MEVLLQIIHLIYYAVIVLMAFAFICEKTERMLNGNDKFTDDKHEGGK